MRDYSRLDHTIFNRARVRALTALVVGAGALGNEVLKNLALVGIGRIVVVDRDTVDATNLTRSVLYCTPDIGAHIARGTPKAVLAAERLQAINPDLTVVPIVGEIGDIGLGLVRASDLVFSCVDNELARLETSWYCTRADRPCVDGGLGNLNASSGAVSLYPGAEGPCYACRKSPERRRQLLWSAQGREDPCWLHERAADAAEIVTTTPVMASIVGALQVESGLRYLAEPSADRRTGTVWTVTLAPQPSMAVRACEPSAACPLHDPPSRVVSATALGLSRGEATPATLFAASGASNDATLLLDWPMTARATCRACGVEWQPFVRRARFRRSACPSCGAAEPVELEVVAEISAGSPWADRTLASLGLPRWHVHEIATTADPDAARLHVELAGDPLPWAREAAAC